MKAHLGGPAGGTVEPGHAPGSIGDGPPPAWDGIQVGAVSGAGSIWVGAASGAGNAVNRFRIRGAGLYCGVVPAQIVVLNGGSSSGKSEIARCLQAVLPDPWLTFGVDTLIDAMPESMQTLDGGIEFAADGGVSVGPAFRALQAAWMEGVAAMARSGARVIIDEVFLGGAASQRQWQQVLGALDVVWVGVRCDSAVAARREAARGDRVQGMAASQADLVHRDVAYDLEVDTTDNPAQACARIIAAHLV